jgi:hypothetical protein
MSPNELTESSWRAAAYHEAGHAIAAYYNGGTLGRIRIFEEHGSIRGETTVIRDHRCEAEIAAAGRVCAEAFGLPQTDLEIAHDRQIFVTRLSDGLTLDDDDTVLEQRIDELHRNLAVLFQREDFRQAARELGERLFNAHEIDDPAQIIGRYVTPHSSALSK